MTTNMRNLSLGLGAAAASSLVMFVAAPSQAATFTNSGVTGTFIGYDCPTTTCVDLATGGYTVSGGFVFDPSDSIHNVAAIPGSDSSDPDKTTSYNITSSIDNPDGASSPIYVTGLDTGVFEFYWGSVDTYNLIEFFKDGAAESFASFTGTDIANALGITDLNPSNGNFGFDAYVKFEGDFTRARLSSTGVAFEVATKAVPEPTAVLSLLAVGAIAGGSTLKRKR